MSKKLDALVAERVMGWPKIGESKSGFFTFHEHHEYGRIQVGPMKESGNFTRPWSPSTQIESAWEVVEKFRSDPRLATHFPFFLHALSARALASVFKTMPGWFFGEADAPLEISVAALRSVDVPESEIQEAMQ